MSLEPYCLAIRYQSSKTKRYKARHYGSEEITDIIFQQIIRNGNIARRRGVPTRIVSLNRIVHLNNLNRFVRSWTVLSGKITSYWAVKIGVQQKVILLENFDQKTIRFIPYCLYWKSWPKDNTVQPILSFKKIFTKRQYDLNHIVF